MTKEEAKKLAEIYAQECFDRGSDEYDYLDEEHLVVFLMSHCSCISR